MEMEFNAGLTVGKIMLTYKTFGNIILRAVLIIEIKNWTIVSLGFLSNEVRKIASQQTTKMASDRFHCCDGGHDYFGFNVFHGCKMDKDFEYECKVETL